MSLFPDYPSLVLAPYEWAPRFRTFVAGPFGNENMVTRANSQFALHSARLSFRCQNTATMDWPAEFKALFQFHADRRGRFESFSFYDIQGWDFTPYAGISWGTYGSPTAGPVYVATQTGAGNQQFDIPARHASQAAVNADSSKHILVNGSDVTVSSWTYNNGADGRTRVQLASAPSLGDVVSCTFTARRVWNARFAEDTLTIRALPYRTWEVSIPLIEVP